MRALLILTLSLFTEQAFSQWMPHSNEALTKDELYEAYKSRDETRFNNPNEFSYALAYYKRINEEEGWGFQEVTWDTVLYIIEHSVEEELTFGSGQMWLSSVKATTPWMSWSNHRAARPRSIGLRYKGYLHKDLSCANFVSHKPMGEIQKNSAPTGLLKGDVMQVRETYTRDELGVNVNDPYGPVLDSVVANMGVDGRNVQVDVYIYLNIDELKEDHQLLMQDHQGLAQDHIDILAAIRSKEKSKSKFQRNAWWIIPVGALITGYTVWELSPCHGYWQGSNCGGNTTTIINNPPAGQKPEDEVLYDPPPNGPGKRGIGIAIPLWRK